MRKYSYKSLKGDLSIETAIRELKLGCNVTMSIGARDGDAEAHVNSNHG